MVLRDRRILVVEYEALVAMLVEDTILDAGAKVVGPAATVADALRLVDEAQIDGTLDAAVLDLNLGSETVMPVADRLVGLGVPFLFATGYAAGCGTSGHTAPILQKPFDPERLITALEALASADR